MLFFNVFFFNSQAFADRAYLDGAIQIQRGHAILLKNMNQNVLQKAKEFDYSFVSRLLTQVFDIQTLCESSAGSQNARKTSYAKLDLRKYKFVQDLFEERVHGDKHAKSRIEGLPTFVNRKCAELRAKHPFMKS